MKVLAHYGSADSLSNSLEDYSPDCDTCVGGRAIQQLRGYQVCARCFGALLLMLAIHTGKMPRLCKRGRPKKAA